MTYCAQNKLAVREYVCNFGVLRDGMDLTRDSAIKSNNRRRCNRVGMLGLTR